MILDVRTMCIAMAATCFIVAAALLTFQARRFRRDGALLWALGWAFQGAFWVLVALRGTVGDFFSVVLANTLFSASYSLLYAAVREFQGRSYNRGILLSPVAATFVFFWCFSSHAEGRIIFISILSTMQISGIVLTLLRNIPVNERRSHWLIGSAFLLMAAGTLNRLAEALTLPYGQLSIVQATTSRSVSVLMALGVVVLSSIGFVLMIRERAEETLRWSEQRFRSLFETSKDSILFINQETGQIVGANRAACRLYGYSPEEFLALNVTDVSAEPEKTKAAVLESVPDVPLRLHRKKDGTLVPVQISGGFFREGALRLDAAFIRDITEPRHALEALEESENKFRDLVEKAMVGVYLVQRGVFRYVNAKFADIHGYDDAEMMRGMDIRTTVFPEDLPPVETDEWILGEDMSHCRRFRIVRRDGKTRYVESYGRNTTYQGKSAVIGMIIDVTDRRNAEEALRWKTTFLEALVDSSRDGILILDNRMQKVLQNERFVEMWKMPTDIAETDDEEQRIRFLMASIKDPREFYGKLTHLYHHSDETIHG